MLVNHSNKHHVNAAMGAMLSLSALGGMISTGLLGPFRMSFAQEYRLTQGQLGHGIAVIAIIFGTLGTWLGPVLADRIGRYALLKFSVGLMTVGLAGCFFWSNLYVLMAFWGLFTLGAFLSIMVNAVATDLWHERPRRGVILLQSMNSLGKIVGPSAAAFLIVLMAAAAWHPWQAFFLFAGIASLAVFTFLLFIPQDKVYQPREQHSYEEGQASQPLGMWMSAMLLGMIAGSENALATIAPAFYSRVRHLPPQRAAELLTMHVIALTAGRFTFGFFGQRLGPRTIAALGLLPTLLIIPAICSGSRMVYSMSFILLGLCFSAAWPLIFSHMAGSFAANRSRMTMAVGLMNAIGIALGLFVTSEVFDRRPNTAMLYGPALLAVCVVGFIASQTDLARRLSEHFLSPREADEAAIPPHP